MSPSSLQPETRYAASQEGGYVAYQVFGSGPPDLVFITHWATNVDAMWEEPSLAAYMEYRKQGTQ